jgi:hypothetical protein
VHSVSLLLSPILRNRLDEEDGPTAIDDLEAHAVGRCTPTPEPALPASVQPPPPEPGAQTYGNRKRAKRRMKNFKQHGRQSKIQKVQEYVQLSQEPELVDLNTKTLPAANNAYSSLRLCESGKDKQKSPGIEELLAQGFRYIAAQDVDDGIAYVVFFLPRAVVIFLPVHRGRSSIRKAASSQLMQACPLVMITRQLANAFAILSKLKVTQTTLTKRKNVTSAATFHRLISAYPKGMGRQKQRD